MTFHACKRSLRVRVLLLSAVTCWRHYGQPDGKPATQRRRSSALRRALTLCSARSSNPTVFCGRAATSADDSLLHLEPSTLRAQLYTAPLLQPLHSQSDPHDIAVVSSTSRSAASRLPVSELAVRQPAHNQQFTAVATAGMSRSHGAAARHRSSTRARMHLPFERVKPAWLRPRRTGDRRRGLLRRLGAELPARPRPIPTSRRTTSPALICRPTTSSTARHRLGAHF